MVMTNLEIVSVLVIVGLAVVHSFRAGVSAGQADLLYELETKGIIRIDKK